MTLNLLEAVRRHAPGAAFVHLSTSKVYGDGPNRLPPADRAVRAWRALEARLRYAAARVGRRP